MLLQSKGIINSYYQVFNFIINKMISRIQLLTEKETKLEAKLYEIEILLSNIYLIIENKSCLVSPNEEECNKYITKPINFILNETQVEFQKLLKEKLPKAEKLIKYIENYKKKIAQREKKK